MKKLFKWAVGTAWQMAVGVISGLIVETCREGYYYYKDLQEFKEKLEQDESSEERMAA